VAAAPGVAATGRAGSPHAPNRRGACSPVTKLKALNILPAIAGILTIALVSIGMEQAPRKLQQAIVPRQGWE
jgi:hypothetical protein